MANTTTITTTCCIAGGGPAGMMTALLLARSGIAVTVLEQYKDFFRDFRGDTIHPTTFQIMHELGLLDAFLQVPHQEVPALSATFNGRMLKAVDFTHLKVVKPTLGLMPQWDFLNFVLKQASQYPHFRLVREAKVTDIISRDNIVWGVKAATPDGPLEIMATLVIGADGRHSTIREKAGLKVIETGAPIDVLWFRLSRQEADPGEALGNFYHGHILILLDRGDYWQCGYVIEKDGFDGIKSKGLDAFRLDLAEISPFLAGRVWELNSWEQVQLLSVAINHLDTWYRDGLLCIGDAAHAMSPIGGVGINLAIQDAVAAANLLYQPLSTNGRVPLDILRRLQKRRTLPTRFIQSLQVAIQNGFIIKHKAVTNAGIPLFFRLLDRFALLRRIPALLIGKGIRPEHVRTPAV